jgi:hypothetical protein
MKKRICLYAAIVILLIAFVAVMLYRPKILRMRQAWLAEEKRRELIEKQKRVKLPDPPVIGRSEDDLHVAWAQLTEDGKLIVVVDGKTDSVKYDDVSFIVMSPKGERIAYPVRKGSKWYVVIDGKEGPAYDEISRSAITFSPDGKRFAYGARKSDRWFVVLDGKAFPEDGHDFVGYFAFSPDSKKFVYAARKGNQQSFVVNGKAGRMYNVTSEPVFSPDSKHLAYIAIDSNNLQCIVLDGKEGKEYKWVTNPMFSSDSKHIAYSVMKEGEKRLVVVDGKEGPVYEMQRAIDPVIFGPNDNRVAYGAMKGGKGVAVIDEKEGPLYDGIGGEGASIALSPDGESFAYAAYIGEKWFVVLNGEEERKYDDIASGSPIFSPDGKHLFYGARKGGKWLVVIDGKEAGDEYEEISKGAVFSSDSKHLMYTAMAHGKWFVVLDGKAGPGYDRLFKPAFKDNGIEYLAERESDGRLLHLRQPYPDSDIDAEAYKAIVQEIVLASLPEPGSECESCKRNK